MMIRFVLSVATIACMIDPAHAWLQQGCNNRNYSASEIADAIRNSPDASDTLKAAACDFGAAALAESGGNTCERNNQNFGVLQLNKNNIPDFLEYNQYLNSSLQDQVDIWARQVGNTNTIGGYQTLVNAMQNDSTIGGTTPTSGMLAACFQFGSAICQNDINFMRRNGGACPTPQNGGININTLPRSEWSRANLDGNNQSICSWGRAIQNRINATADACKGAQAANCGPGDFFPNSPVPMAGSPPLPAATDVMVPEGAI
jgi:hypothetical protein